MKTPRPQHHATSGFTLIELLIVIVVISIIVTIALPNLLSARVATHETAAISTMHQIIQAQIHFANSQAADPDVNGCGGFGTFGELSGSVAVRAAAGGTHFLDPSLISPAFRNVSALGEMSRGGYIYRLYLPDAAGNGVPELPGGGASAAVDTSASERLWCVYAWPQDYEVTGRRTFFANQSGNLLFTDDSAYDGPGAPIPPGAAFAAPGSPAAIDGTAAVNEAARDGNLWRVAGN